MSDELHATYAEKLAVFLKQFQSSAPTASMLLQSGVLARSETTITVTVSYSFHYERLTHPEIFTTLENCLHSVFGPEWSCTVEYAQPTQNHQLSQLATQSLM